MTETATTPPVAERSSAPARRTAFDYPLAQLSLMRLREFVREPEAVFWTLLFPVLLAAGLGVAFRGQPAAVLNIAAVTPDLAAALRPEPQLAVTLETPALAAQSLRAGKVALVVEPGPGGTVVYRFDDTNPDGRTARMLADRAVQRAAGRRDLIPSRDAVSREPGDRYIDFLVPGLVGMTIMGNSIWSLAFSIVDARRRKLLKRIVATPMRRHEYLLSFLVWRMVLLVVEVAVPVGFGMAVFGVPLRGSIVSLVALSVLASLAFSGIGLLIASRVRTIEGASGLTNLAMMPMWILSGVFFSSQRFPDLVQPAIKALPLTATVDALRAIMLQGATLASTAPQAAILASWAAAGFGLALLLFRWR